MNHSSAFFSGLCCITCPVPAKKCHNVRSFNGVETEQTRDTP